MSSTTIQPAQSGAGVGASPAQSSPYYGSAQTFSGDANSLYQQVTSSEWSDYMTNFVPIENQLISFASNANAPAQAMQTASGIQTQAMAQQPQIQANRLGQYQTQLDKSGTQAAGLNLTLSSALGQVDAQNQAKDATIQEQESILGAPMTGLT